MEAALDKVERLRGVAFDWKTSSKPDIGLIAEEVAEVVPEGVGFAQDGGAAESVDYGRITALLIEAIKEQQSQITQLRLKITKSDDLLTNS